ncbi:6524_t:CDS:2 [Entrophospora sp. SA101]|nr:6524_t:CDS:2 [Entrophospora sp. SA101]CAJ0828445.1 3714_t:CDS:2 [Entrophospora sp. SA101]CAJ0903653.1 4943_t:CDS:2 [Entrophospora sp. SA101]CAJ0924557.1 17813_t:CDS:2 [Entrophospora sp. SA101]
MDFQKPAIPLSDITAISQSSSISPGEYECGGGGKGNHEYLIARLDDTNTYKLQSIRVPDSRSNVAGIQSEEIDGISELQPNSTWYYCSQKSTSSIGPTFYYPNITDFMLVLVVDDIDKYLSTSSSSSSPPSFSYYPDVSCASKPIRRCLKNSKTIVLSSYANYCLVVVNPSVNTIDFSIALTFDKNTQISNGGDNRNKMIGKIFVNVIVIALIVFLIV